jgi:ribosomal protein S14
MRYSGVFKKIINSQLNFLKIKHNYLIYFLYKFFFKSKLISRFEKNKIFLYFKIKKKNTKKRPCLISGKTKAINKNLNLSRHQLNRYLILGEIDNMYTNQ